MKFNIVLLILGVATVSYVSCDDVMTDADLIKELENLTGGATAPTEDPFKKIYVSGKYPQITI